ncbi:ligand-binding protein SH3 [Bacillus sp. V3-13]|uniref:DMT family transporter n=1 Tax=Bacillus sp. V3-13 TaxID=2053728 RepID=UPI000C77A7B7|nr:multidrug efflux SMR transporter [Bacillus sp. V3-13]PLR77313.1 ligand-binding protein SH3 [Bacillus sp. V3-13]
MAWFYLLLAGLSEIGWAFGLKYSKGFTEPVPTVMTIMLIIVSFILFAKAMKTIPIGTAYAVFTGIGAAGTALIGMVFLGEPAGWLKVMFISLLLGGIIGLKLSSNDKDERAEGVS